MIGNNLWDDEARALLLHLVPGVMPHDPAQIRGSREALRRCAEACLKAADARQGEGVEIEMMDANGEHYGLTVVALSDRQMVEKPPIYLAYLGR